MTTTTMRHALARKSLLVRPVHLALSEQNTRSGFGFQKASENVVKGRKILTAKRRTAPAASSGAFAGFGAFGGFGGAKAEEAPVAAVVPAAAEPVADAAASDWKCDVQTLSSGHSIPMVGLGTWKADKENEVGNAVKWALPAIAILVLHASILLAYNDQRSE